MPRKSGEIIFRKLIAKIIEQKKGIIVRGVAEPESTPQMHARAFHSGFGLDQLLDRTDGHGVPPIENGNAKSQSTTEARRRGENSKKNLITD
jgi:hypothetical protein